MLYFMWNVSEWMLRIICAPVGCSFQVAAQYSKNRKKCILIFSNFIALIKPDGQVYPPFWLYMFSNLLFVNADPQCRPRLFKDGAPPKITLMQTSIEILMYCKPLASSASYPVIADTCIRPDGLSGHLFFGRSWSRTVMQLHKWAKMQKHF